MPTQHLSSFPTSFATIQYIDIRRTNPPAGIRKGYEYFAPTDYDQFKANLQQFLTTHEKYCQYTMFTIKKYKYGEYLKLWALGSPGGEYDPTLHRWTGINALTATIWKRLTGRIQRELTRCLGKDATLYTEPFDPDQKPQLRFEAKIQL